MTSALAELTKEEKADECVQFAMKLRDAWSLQNYHRFFLLYHTAPKMSGYLIDWFINRERKAALRIIVKSYVPQTRGRINNFLFWDGFTGLRGSQFVHCTFRWSI